MNISDLHNCADCGACYNACPVNAISVKDRDLFYTPTVNADLCIGCGKCVDVCPVNNDLPTFEPLCAYSAVHRDKQIISQSSSGGMFTALAESVISNNGVVYAAAYSEDCRNVLFMCSENVPLDDLRRSKYVESSVGNVFRDIRERLKSGRRILFCGAPCQVAGLYRYLCERPANLLTCDFTCGGMPSHQLYREYLEGLEKKYHARAVKVNFRPKAFGWREYAVRVDFDNGRHYLNQACLDPYFAAFLHKQYSIRDYCVSCRFTDHHQADIVLADFWKARQLTSENDDDTGISLVIAMTETGRLALNDLSALARLRELPLDQALYNFQPKASDAAYLENRRRFLEACRKEGVFSAGKKYCTLNGTAALKAKLRGYSRRK